MTKVDHRTAVFSLDNDGYVWIKLKEHADIFEQDILEFSQILDDLCDQKKRMFFIDTRNTYANISPAARKLLATNLDIVKWRMADAILVNSLHMRLLANAYRKLDSPTVLIRVFSDVEKAKIWFREVEELQEPVF